MSLRSFNREQAWLLPPSLDEMIPDDHPARFVAAFVDNLDRTIWLEMEIDPNGDHMGAPAYHPGSLLSVWLYGFMTGTRSSRKLEAACRDQIPYLWLTGWQHPDHNTLWRFYRDHRASMRRLFKHTVRTAIHIGLVDLALQAIDGTKIEANASKQRTYNKKELQRLQEKTEAAIKDLEEQNETGDDPPPLYLPKDLTKARRLRDEVKTAMEKLDIEGKKRVNLSDGDAKLMKGKQGIIAGYNMQAVVSPVSIDHKKDSSFLITGIDVVTDEGDTEQLLPMLEQAEEMTGQRAEVSLADAGYHSGKNLEQCAQRNQKVLMPECGEYAFSKPYYKDRFVYDSVNDTYVCPQGHALRYRRSKISRHLWKRQYRAIGKICRQCHAFGICTRSKNGRILEVGPYDNALRHHRDLMATRDAQELFSLRKQLPEPTFGIIKEQMGFRRFLTRRLSNVKAEATVMATAFNLRTLYKAWKLHSSPSPVCV
jgi:transposase